MRTKVREVLDQVEDVLLSGGQDATDLWDILCALRGPDKDAVGEAGKYNGTIPVRRQVFPRLTSMLTSQPPRPGCANFSNGPMFGAPLCGNAKDRVNYEHASWDHFKSHCLAAQDAIDRGIGCYDND